MSTGDLRVCDTVAFNGERLRIEHIGAGDYSVYVVGSYGDRFTLDRSELTLTTPRGGPNLPAVWTCWTDADGRRA